MKLPVITAILTLVGTATAVGSDFIHSDTTAVTKQRPKFNIAEDITSVGAGLVIDAGITEVLKHTVHELRPDRSENNSFPSRHTSWAFGLSTALSNRLYVYSTWWSVGLQTVAGAVGIQRIATGRHWGSDVVAGATVGIVSAEAGQLLSRAIFHSASPWKHCPEADFTPTFSVSSDATWWFNSSGHPDFRAAFGTTLHFRLPLSDRWGISASAQAMSMPVKGIAETNPLSTAILSVGGIAYFPVEAGPLAFSVTAEAGACRWIGRSSVRPGDWAFAARIGADAEWRLTRSFAFRAGPAFRTLGAGHLGIDLSVGSVVIF
ncbi:MAG: phosphatase PAP2 family protein [Muribaculaceae bacterium]|nr:phosphatase PAP2 family protein [Muribaculaceae bacterium]